MYKSSHVIVKYFDFLSALWTDPPNTKMMHITLNSSHTNNVNIRFTHTRRPIDNHNLYLLIHNLRLIGKLLHIPSSFLSFGSVLLRLGLSKLKDNPFPKLLRKTNKREYVLIVLPQETIFPSLISSVIYERLGIKESSYRKELRVTFENSFFTEVIFKINNADYGI